MHGIVWPNKVLQLHYLNLFFLHPIMGHQIYFSLNSPNILPSCCLFFSRIPQFLASSFSFALVTLCSYLILLSPGLSKLSFDLPHHHPPIFSPSPNRFLVITVFLAWFTYNASRRGWRKLHAVCTLGKMVCWESFQIRGTWSVASFISKFSILSQC